MIFKNSLHFQFHHTLYSILSHFLFFFFLIYSPYNFSINTDSWSPKILYALRFFHPTSRLTLFQSPKKIYPRYNFLNKEGSSSPKLFYIPSFFHPSSQYKITHLILFQCWSNLIVCFQVVSPQAAARDVVTHAILAPGVDDRVAGWCTAQQRVAEAASRRRRQHLQPLRLPQHQHESGPQKRHRHLDLPRTDPRCFQESNPHNDQTTPTGSGVRWRLSYGVLR